MSSADQFWRDRHGRVVILQRPNLPLLVWFAATILAKLSAGAVSRGASLVAFGAIFTWGWMEIFQGSSRFRRLLGLVVLVLSVRSRIG